MNIINELINFDFNNPNWHVVDIMRGINLINFVGIDSSITENVYKMIKFLECNQNGRNKADIEYKRDAVKFVEFSRIYTMEEWNLIV